MHDIFYKNTSVLGILGHPIKHSYSPFIHNLSAQLLKLNYIYLPFDVPINRLDDALKGVIALGFKGFSVTLPYKEMILPHLQSVSEEASFIGSVNTVVNELGVLTGHNTDVYGVFETLNPFKDEISGLETTILGSGGVARAIIYNLIRYFKPSRINIVNRSEQRAESLKDYFKEKLKFDDITTYELFPPDILQVMNSSKLIVNATPLGMFPDIDDSPITSPKAFVKNQIAFDLVYNPAETKFLKIAKSEGAQTLNGMKTLIHQAIKSFELWTGHKPPYDEIYTAVTKHIGQ